jgi:uncharacterized SAM-binding protein YcdF (DUF218 family)
MSLLTFHRILIAAGIAFCFGYGLWEGRAALRGEGSFILAGTFLLLGGGLSVYLARLSSFLGYREDDGIQGDAGPGG